MKSMQQRLVQLQQENANLEKTIHDMNAAKAEAIKDDLAASVDIEGDMGDDGGGPNPLAGRDGKVELSSHEGAIIRRYDYCTWMLRLLM